MNASELRKALTTSSAPELIPYDLEPTLGEELLRLQPLAQLLSIVQAEGLTHEYRMKTSHPMAWFEGETSGANNKSGSYSRKSVMLKIARIWGEVTGFAQKVDEKFINALADELNGSLQGMADLLEYGVMYGTANDIGFTGDELQFSGILPRLYAFAPENVIDAGGAKVSLDLMDQALAVATKHRQTRNDPGLWMMGLRMKQIVDGLQTKIQLPLNGVTLADGKVTMDAYAKRGIMETDYLVPEATTTSPAATGAQAAEGALVAGTYTYCIASVTAYGEQVAGTASQGIVADETHKGVDLSWDKDPAAKLYMIFRKTGSGSFQLLDIIPALTYNGDGEVNGAVETYTDAGSKTTKAIKPLAAGEQTILYANTNPDRGAAFVGMVDDMGRQIDRLVSFVELGRAKDAYGYFLKTYLTLRVKYTNLFSAVRHVKVA